MIAFVRGEIAGLEEDNVIIDTGNLGYNVKISSGTANALPGIGQVVKLYTYTLVREDIFQLYGFLTKDDLAIFKKLITVNGIGPKGGLAILSIMSADDLRFAIIAGDAKAISKAPGIGSKTAERVILDLRDKVSLEDTMLMRDSGATGITNVEDGSAKNEAIEALVALGYSASDALRAVKQVEMTETMDTEAILKAALKKMY